MRRSPGLWNDANRRLLAHSLFGRWVRQNEDPSGVVHERVAIPARRLAVIEKREREYHQKRYSGGRFLEQHRGVLPDFGWTGYQPGQWPRQVERDGIPPDLMDLLLDDLATPVHEMGAAVDLWTLDAVPNPYRGRGLAVRKAALDAARAEASRRRNEALSDEQGRLLDMLNAVPFAITVGVVKRNVVPAVRECLMVKPKLGVRSRLRYDVRALMDLRRLQYQPHSFYAPSRKRRTVRVFPTSYPSVAGLRSQVRKSILGGCVAADLTNAQLALAAAGWEVRPVLDLLERDGSAWPYLLDRVCGLHDADDSEAKAALKVAVYSTVFGMGAQGVRYRLGLRLSFAAAAAFVTSPVVEALFEKRGAALEQIEAHGGGIDCFGTFYPVREGRDVEEECRSVLAGLMQARELELLMPVVDEAALVAGHDRPAFTPVAWLHDGFVVKARHGADAVGRRLARKVEAHADTLGVPTALEFSVL